MTPSEAFERGEDVMTHTLYPCKNAGVAYIMALVLLTMFASMAVAVTTETNLNMRKAANLSTDNAAQLHAEGGLAHLSYLLRKIDLPGAVANDQALQAVNQALPGLLGAGNLHGRALTYVAGTKISVPFIQADAAGKGYAADLELINGTFRLTVTSYSFDPAQAAGQREQAKRKVRVNLKITAPVSSALDYGVASRGSIHLTGNTKIAGSGTNANWGKVLAATSVTLEAVDITGNCTISGDLFVSDPDAYVSLTGNVSVGGESRTNNASQHIHLGVGTPGFPEPNVAAYNGITTTVIDSNTNLTGTRTFTNIRIKAGTNPNFSGTDTINGLVYIESPNNVTFSGNVYMTGVIVTDDARGGNIANNTLNMTGNVSLKGVDQLPNTAEFTALKQLPGMAILAPGFSVAMTGNFGSVGGTLAADQFQFTGNAGGTVKGSVMSWRDSSFTMTGNSNIVIDRSGGTALPAGLTMPSRFYVDPATYEEPTQ
jgi:hypothetical protein